jgi:hypothetical protein
MWPPSTPVGGGLLHYPTQIDTWIKEIHMNTIRTGVTAVVMLLALVLTACGEHQKPYHYEAYKNPNCAPLKTSIEHAEATGYWHGISLKEYRYYQTNCLAVTP